MGTHPTESMKTILSLLLLLATLNVGAADAINESELAPTGTGILLTVTNMTTTEGAALRNPVYGMTNAVVAFVHWEKQTNVITTLNPPEDQWTMYAIVGGGSQVTKAGSLGGTETTIIYAVKLVEIEGRVFELDRRQISQTNRTFKNEVIRKYDPN